MLQLSSRHVRGYHEGKRQANAETCAATTGRASTRSEALDTTGKVELTPRQIFSRGGHSLSWKSRHDTQCEAGESWRGHTCLANHPRGRQSGAICHGKRSAQQLSVRRHKASLPPLCRTPWTSVLQRPAGRVLAPQHAGHLASDGSNVIRRVGLDLVRRH